MFWLFLVSGFVLAVTPGPAVLYLVARSVDQGRKAGAVSCLGVFAACIVHVAAAVLGLSALLASSAALFALIRWAGALYLVYLGLRAWFSKPDLHAEAPSRASLGKVWWDGFVVNLLNPKTTLFFLAFLPQFVEPSLGNVSAQIAILGLSFATLALATDLTWAFVAGTLGAKLKSRLSFRRWQQRASALVYFALGALAVGFNESK